MRVPGRRAGWSIAASAVVAGVALVASTGAAGASAMTPSLRSAVVRALAADQGLPGEPFGSVTSISDPPSLAVAEAYVTGAINQAKAIPATALAGQKAASVSALKSAYSSLLPRLFSQSALKEEEFRAQQAEGGAADAGVMQLGGGASAIRITSVSVTGGSAHVTATVEDWLATAVRQPTGAWAISVPVGPGDFTLDLAEQDGGWVVSTLSLKVPSGSGL